MATTAKKAAPKKAAVKIDTALCRWGGGRYYSLKTAKSCTNPHAPKKALCAEHEVAYRTAKKAAKPAAPKAAANKPRSAGTSPKTSGDPMAREIAATKAMKARLATQAGDQNHAEPASPGA